MTLAGGGHWSLNSNLIYMRYALYILIAVLIIAVIIIPTVVFAVSLRKKD